MESLRYASAANVLVAPERNTASAVQPAVRVPVMTACAVSAPDAVFLMTASAVACAAYAVLMTASAERLPPVCVSSTASALNDRTSRSTASAEKDDVMGLLTTASRTTLSVVVREKTASDGKEAL